MEIRTANRADEGRLLDTITLAFAADPSIRFWWPDATDFLHWWPRFALARGERGFDAGTIQVTDDMSGVAMWLPPGVTPDPAQVAALQLPGSDEEDAIAAELRQVMESYHPPEPHWYLWCLGVDPRCQGRGVGSALMRHMLARIDAERATSFLEASDPKNVPFYERHGYEVLGVIELHGLPPLTPMVRPAR